MTWHPFRVYKPKSFTTERSYPACSRSRLSFPDQRKKGRQRLRDKPHLDTSPQLSPARERTKISISKCCKDGRFAVTTLWYLLAYVMKVVYNWLDGLSIESSGWSYLFRDSLTSAEVQISLLCLKLSSDFHSFCLYIRLQYAYCMWMCCLVLCQPSYALSITSDNPHCIL